MGGLFKKKDIFFFTLSILMYVLSPLLTLHIEENKNIIIIILKLCFIVLVSYYSKKRNLNHYIGLCKINGRMREFCYFFPLLIIGTANAWNGFELKWDIIQSCIYIMEMILVGYIEEVLFRGFLFSFIKEKSVIMAFIISPCVFGSLHIVNLFSERDLYNTIVQILYATVLGYLFCCVFFVSKSIIPNIICHVLINALGIFYGNNGISGDIIIIYIIIISVWYGTYLLFKDKFI